MNDTTSKTIADAVLRVSLGISDGTLTSRLCYECGDVKHDGPCAGFDFRPDPFGLRLKSNLP